MNEPRPPDDPLPTEDRPIPFGRYQLLELVGEGAMAQVFRATQSGPMGFTKEVALKRLRTGAISRDRKEMEALVNEARLGGQLRHPNIVEIYGCDVHDGTFFLAMEYVRGWLLDDVLWRLIEADERLPPPAIIDILRQIAHGLTYAHEAVDTEGFPLRLVHRDLKPQNIFLDRTGVVKIADFGLAKSTAALYRTTDADETKGSPLYMSPEQIGGSAIDSRSDLFAFGTIIIEFCTGLRAFEGNSIPNTLMKVLNVDCEEAMSAMTSQAPGLLPIVGRLLQANPGQRYQTAREVARDLDLLAGEAVAGSHTRALVGALLNEEPVGLPETIKTPYRELSSRLQAVGAQEPLANRPRRAAPGPAWKEPRGSQSVVLAETKGGTKALPERRAERRRKRALKRWGTIGGLLLLAGSVGAVALLWAMNLGPASIPEEEPEVPPSAPVAAEEDLGSAPPPPLVPSSTELQRVGPAIHMPRASARVGQDLPIAVQMTEAGEWSVTAMWRPWRGQYRPLAMDHTGDGRFEGRVPLVEEVGQAVDYYIEFDRGAGVRTIGGADAPFRVVVLDR
ncbi:MAG: serine/threonine protein kinase [Proteobacteria bacterium]|nr:serine/threonine protein kinase [Pseudomonadota bacterium]